MREGRVVAGAFAVLSLALGGFSCDKKSVPRAPDPGPAVPFEAPPGSKPPAASAGADGGGTAAAPAPASGSKFDELAEKLPSPCGKPESLKRTLEADPGCKSGPYAKKFVVTLQAMDAPDDELADLYRKRFTNRENPSFVTRESPFIGTPGAPVTIVIFYDYGCPHCKEAEPLLEKVVADNPKDVIVYFKMYPLRKETMDAARGALAAMRQGKFREMHQALFANQSRLSRDDVVAHAKELGLDMAKFEKDLSDPALTARIEAERDEGRKAGLEGTPMIFENGRRYHNIFSADPISDWVEEDLALNR